MPFRKKSLLKALRIWPFRTLLRMRKTYLSVDHYLHDQPIWQEALGALVDLLRQEDVEETIKWSTPVYMYRGSNILGLGAFKHHCTLSFFHGALLSDAEGVLLKPGENTQAGRWIKFCHAEEVHKMAPILKTYIQEAIDVARAGHKIEMKTVDEYAVPKELQSELSQDPSFEEAWNALTPGRRRAYLLFFDSAKQSATKTDRILKYRPRMLQGKGINYCICGLSKRMPNCDGSHKQLKEA